MMSEKNTVSKINLIGIELIARRDLLNAVLAICHKQAFPLLLELKKNLQREIVLFFEIGLV